MYHQLNVLQMSHPQRQPLQVTQVSLAIIIVHFTIEKTFVLYVYKNYYGSHFNVVIILLVLLSLCISYSYVC